MMIVDAHLDLAYNALRGRAVTRPAREQTPDEDGTPAVGLPDLERADVRLICGTIFTEPYNPATAPGGYHNPTESHRHALAQLRWYQDREREGHLSLVRRAEDLATLRTRPLKTIILMEGADPLRSPEDVALFHAAGLRIVGLAWKRTACAGGAGEPGPLTPLGRTIVRSLDEHRIIHDASHLADDALSELLDLTEGPLIASHSNARAIIPRERHLTDDTARAIARRGGVIGLVLYDRFLVPPDEYDLRKATLTDFTRQARYFSDLLGTTKHLGLGSDMDGGFGLEHLPAGLTTAADLPRLADALSAADFPDSDVAGILGQNWLRYFTETLP